jgi:DNA polymerase-3 subunit gamma/tau
MILRGAAAEALAELQAQYADGADPMAVLRDLAEITHWVSIVKITPEAIEDPTIGPMNARAVRTSPTRIPMRALTRLWQMLLKALEEVGQAPNAMMAAEMAIIRLTHVADLPDPEALIRKVQTSVAAGEFARSPPPPRSARPMRRAPAAPHLPRPARSSVAIRADGAAMAIAVSPDALAAFPDFESVIELIRRMRDMKLLLEVEEHLRLVRYSPGRIEFQPGDQRPARFALRLANGCAAGPAANAGRSASSPRAASPASPNNAPRMRPPPAPAPWKTRRCRRSLPPSPGAKSSRSARSPRRSRLKSPAGEDKSPHELTEGPVAEVEEWDPFEDED